MNNTELYFQDYKVDLNEGQSILLTKSIDDIYNPGKIKNDFTKSIILPNTPNNNEILGQIWSVNKSVIYHPTDENNNTGKYFNPSKKTPFKLYVVDVLVYSGYAKLNIIQNDINKTEYEVTLFGELGGFLQKFKDINLGDFLADTNSYGKSRVLFNPKSYMNLWNARWTGNGRHSLNESQLYNTTNFNGVTVNTGFNSGTKNLYLDWIDAENGLYNEGNNIYTANFDANPSEPYIVTDLTYKYSESDLTYKLAHKQRVGFYNDMLIGSLIKKAGYNLVLSDFTRKTNPYWANTLVTGKILDTNFEGSFNSKLQISSYKILGGNGDKTKSFISNCINSGLYPAIEGASITDTNLTIDGNTISVKALTLTDMKPDYLEYNMKLKTNPGYEFIFELPDWIDNGWSAGVPYMIRSGSISVNISNILLKNSTTFKKFGSETQIKLGSSAEAGVVGNEKNELGIFQAQIRGTGYNVGKFEIYVKDYNVWMDLNDYLVNHRQDLFKISPIPTSYITESNISNVKILNCISFTSNYGIIDCLNETNKIDFTSLSSFNVNAYLASDVIKSFNKVGNSSLIPYSKLLPDCKALDYFLSYVKLFGLYIDIDESAKTVKLLTRNEFYNKGDIKDLSNNFMYDKPHTILPLNFDKKFIELKYKDGKTYPAKDYRERNGKEYGSIKLITGYEFNDQTFNYFDNLIFEPIINVAKDKYIYGKDVDPKVQPHLYEGKFESSKIYNPIALTFITDTYVTQSSITGAFLKNPNLLYFIVGQNNDSVELYNEKDSYNFEGFTILPSKMNSFILRGESNQSIGALASNGRKYIPTLNIFSFPTQSNNQYSLDIYYPDEIYYDSQYATANTYNATIYERFFKAFLEDRYNVDTKVFNGSFYLNANERYTLKLSDIIFFKDKYWSINKIKDMDLNNINTPVELELVSINDITNYTNGINL